MHAPSEQKPGQQQCDSPYGHTCPRHALGAPRNRFFRVLQLQLRNQKNSAVPGDNGPNSIVVGTCCRNASVWTRAVESCLSRDPESVPGHAPEPNTQCLNLRFTMLEAALWVQASARPAASGHRSQGPSAAMSLKSRSEEHTSELQSLRHLVCR